MPGMRRLAAPRCSLVLAGCGETAGRARAAASQVSGIAGGHAGRRARRCPTARCGSRSSPTARRRASSGRSSATASTRRRAGSTCSSTTSRPTSIAGADERADRPGGRDQAGRARGLDPASRARARDPARGGGRHPGRLDQLRQRPLQARSACSPTSGRSRTAPVWRRGGGSPTRACGNALCLNQQVGNIGARRPLRRAGPGDARGRRRARACSRSSTTTRARRAGSRRAVEPTTAPTACWPRTRSAGWPPPRASRARRSRSARSTSGRTCSRPSRRAEIGFAVDQQAYLQGYLPIEMLALRARYGIFPAQDDVVATGPNFVTRDERRAGAGAERAVDSLGGGLRSRPRGRSASADAAARGRLRARRT